MQRVFGMLIEAGRARGASGASESSGAKGGNLSAVRSRTGRDKKKDDGETKKKELSDG